MQVTMSSTVTYFKTRSSIVLSVKHVPIIYHLSIMSHRL